MFIVAAPGTPGIFKPAMGAAQIITPQAQIRPTTPVVNRVQEPGSFTTMQIPATLTIRNTTPTSHPRVTSVPSTQHSTQLKPLPINTETKIGEQTLSLSTFKYGMCMILDFRLSTFDSQSCFEDTKYAHTAVQ